MFSVVSVLRQTRHCRFCRLSLRPTSAVPTTVHSRSASVEVIDSITVIPGDGAHPEIIDHCKNILRHMKIPVKIEEFKFSYQQNKRNENDDVKAIHQSIRKNKISLVGHISPPPVDYQGESLHLINVFNLFANVTWIKSLPGIEYKHGEVDFVIVREQLEGEYKKKEHAVWSKDSGTAVESLKVISRQNSERIARFAFDYATKWGRSKVTAIHKANIMKQGDGMFLHTCQRVAKLYPDIEFSDMIIDNASMQMVSNPQQFDVIVTTNLYGNILENLGAGLIGGVGVVAGEDWSHEEIMYGMGARHPYWKAAGKDIANPTFMLLSTSNMLRKLYFYDESAALREAIYNVYREGKTLTEDFKGTATGAQFLEAVKKHLG